MGWASERLIELHARRQNALDRLPGTLEESLQVIATLQEQVEDLRKQVAAQGSARERYKEYVIGGIIGALISMLLTALL